MKPEQKIKWAILNKALMFAGETPLDAATEITIKTGASRRSTEAPC